MTQILKNTVLGAVAISLSAMLPSKAATMTSGYGDLVLSVYSSSGFDIAPMTYSINLGTAFSFISMDANDCLANINLDLITAFGNDWASDETIRFVLSGGNPNAAPANEVAKTIYVGVGLTSMSQITSIPMGC